MLYYKVKPEYDNFKLLKLCGNRWEHYGILVGNELLTEKELNKSGILYMRGVKPEMFEKVEVSRKSVYWCFGARFSEKTGGVCNG